MQKMILFVLSLSVFMLAGCTTPKLATTEYASDGSLIRSSVAMSGKQFVELESVKATEQSRAACYAAQTNQKAESDLGRVALALANKGVDCGAGYNEVLIAKEKGKTERFQAGVGGLLGIGKFGFGGYVAGKAFDNSGKGVSIENNGNSNQTSLGANAPNNNSFEQSNQSNDNTACAAKGGDRRAATVQEVSAGLAVAGFVCSDGAGGFL